MPGLTVKSGIQNNNGIISVSTPLNIPEIKGLGCTLFEKILENSNQIAQIDGLTCKQETWDQVLEKSIRTAISMRSRGITQGQIISNCSLMHLNSCVPIIASLFLGAKIANFDPTLALPDMVHLLQQVSPTMIFVDPEGVKSMEEALGKAKINADIVVFGKSRKHLQFSEFLKPSPEERSFKPVEIKDVKETAAILFSSGTTGLPKGICLSHYALLAPKFNNEGFSGKVFLAFAPSYYWISSLTALLISVLSGMTRVLCPKLDVDKAWDVIAENKVNLMYLGPSQLVALWKKGRPENVDLSSLQLIIVGGGPVNREQMTEVREIFKGTLVGNFYGATEMSGNGLWWSPEEDYNLLLKNPESAGRPFPGHCYKIVDPETEQILGPNQRGELRIKSDYAMNCYYNIESSDAWDADGFLKTGDIAYYDEDYCFFIVDRIREMMKYHGFFMVPAKLEGVLLSHPDVESAVVFGIPHPEDGDHPMGVVALKRDFHGTLTGEDLEVYVEQRVDQRQKLRAGVRIVKSIPTNVTGKFNRRRIRDLVLNNAI